MGSLELFHLYHHFVSRRLPVLHVCSAAVPLVGT